MEFMFGVIVALIVVMVLHEAGHLAAAKCLGIPVKRLSIGFGPVWWRHAINSEIEMIYRLLPVGMSVAVLGRRDDDGRLRRPPSHDMWMAASGPLANLLVTVLTFALVFFLPLSPALSTWLVITGLLSIALGVLNLAPIPGMDGGHLLVLALVERGWRLSPRQELRLHRMGANLLAAAISVPVFIRAWIWLTT